MVTTVVAISVVLVLVILVLIFRVQSLIAIARGSDKKSDGMLNRFNASMFLVFLIGGMGACFWYTFAKTEDYLLPEAVSIHGKATDHLMLVTMVVIGIVFVVVSAVLFIFSYMYQYKEGRRATFYPENSILELVWTIIPAIVLTYLVFNGWKEWTKITTTPNATVLELEKPTEVEIVGQQFFWSVRYPGNDNVLGKHYYKRIDDDNAFGLKVEDTHSWDDFYAPASEKAMYLPVGRKVHLKIRAKDVLHSVFLPHFRVKMDAVPGTPTEFWFTPTKTTLEMRNELANNPKYQEGDKWKSWNYEIACTEICGSGHNNMRFNVVVVTQEEYDEWYKNQVPWTVGREDYIKSSLSTIDPDKVKFYNSFAKQFEDVEPVEVEPEGTIAGEPVALSDSTAVDSVSSGDK